MNFIRTIADNLKRYIVVQQYNPGFGGLWLNPFFHARRELYRHMEQFGTQMTGRVLDVGCGRKPYRKLFPATAYVGLEIDTPENRARNWADAFYQGESFPFPDQSFDNVVCNQVLEHVFQPDLFLREVYRVVKPGGNMLISVPFAWDEHEQPRDYARYSSFGLRYLLENAGFQVIEQRKLSADVRVLFQLINAYLYKVLCTRFPAVNLLICAALMAPFNILGALIYRWLPSNPDLYLDQVVLANKKKSS
jgi:SAM-dependent methyltransferase